MRAYVAADRAFEHVRSAVDDAFLFAFGEQRADAGGGEESADAGAAGADAFGEVALRNDLELDLARAVQLVEHPGVDLSRETADHLADAAGLEQCREAGVTVAGVVRHDGQVFRALLEESVDQGDRLPG